MSRSLKGPDDVILFLTLGATKECLLVSPLVHESPDRWHQIKFFILSVREEKYMGVNQSYKLPIPHSGTLESLLKIHPNFSGEIDCQYLFLLLCVIDSQHEIMIYTKILILIVGYRNNSAKQKLDVGFRL